MEEVSKKVRQKAYSLLRERAVAKKLETSRRAHFLVKGETEAYSVIFDKQRKEWSCDCRYFSLRQRVCSHILACKLFVSKSF